MEANKIVIGILAHVDAGKTTLAEGILYEGGSIRKLGRVDHQDAFLDNNEMERKRGITIFSKQAEVNIGEKNITLLDTPGHVDFSAEMERTLWVMDYAILVINGADGVQSHTATLWKLLQYYEIPTFLFVNKMDQPGTDKGHLLAELKERLDERCCDFGDMNSETSLEEIAMCDETLMNEYLENGRLFTESLQRAVSSRKLFPCYFGSALKNFGVKEFLQGIEIYTEYEECDEEFGAKVFKITRDENNNRLTHMRITGGQLKVKSLINEEKADQLRVYSGTQYTLMQEAVAGTICAVTGLENTHAGQGIGAEESSQLPVLEPILTYRIDLPPETDVHQALRWLRQLEEEEPHLQIVWNEALNEIHAKVMGEVEIEILKSILWDRFRLEAEFGEGNIVYKETIAAPVEGVGHFEPLRHYAEAHILLEPLERGAGLQFETDCPEDELAKNWQRLILTHLQEKQHKGVLVGGEITDMKLTLVAGRAHIKHTEGGDFRQATYRAVRHGLKKAESILLEPYYEFRLVVPQENIGRAMTDIQAKYGNFDMPDSEGGNAVLMGRVPVSTMKDYGKEVLAYTKGNGKLFCSLWGYDVCHNAEEVIGQIQYDSEADLENPTGSVFCAHGAGFVVNWQEVEDYMHLENRKDIENADKIIQPYEHRRNGQSTVSDFIDQEEIEEIFQRTYGANKGVKSYKSQYKKTKRVEKSIASEARVYRAVDTKQKDKYLLVDGYNIIFAWEELKELSKVRLDSAREKLQDILCNYQGYTKQTVILVFDAYKVKQNPGTVDKYKNIYVVYTKEAETADQYIEKTVHKIGKECDVTVATSDVLEQMIIWGDGARYLSAARFYEEIEEINHQIREKLDEIPGEKYYPFEKLTE